MTITNLIDIVMKNTALLSPAFFADLYPVDSGRNSAFLILEPDNYADYFLPSE